MTENEISLQDLYSSISSPRYYGQKYLDADSEDELLLILGEACCISAFSLINIFKLPKRGRIILDFIKAFFPKRYHKYLFLYNFSFSQCLIYIIQKLKAILKRELSEKDAERISSTAYACAGSFLVVASKYSEEDKKMLFNEMEKRLYDYDKYETIEEKILLKNIIKELDRNITHQQIVIFFRETIEKDSLYIVEPFRFIERFKEVKS